MRVTVLGSGTSSGVPVPGCQCKVCTSDNPKNERLRASIYIELFAHETKDLSPNPNQVPSEPDSPTLGILIDTAPDLRQQALKHKITKVDAVCYTHAHADHINGIDDLRCFNFLQKKPIEVYADQYTSEQLTRMFNYAFFSDPNYGGGAPPKLNLNLIEAYQAFTIANIKLLPLPVKHGIGIAQGFRIGNFAYLTDCSEIPPQTREQLKDLDTLIIDGLRNRPHPTHFTQEQAVREIEDLQPRRAYLTHISHEVDHDEGNTALQALTTKNVSLAYDGLQFECSL